MTVHALRPFEDRPRPGGLDALLEAIDLPALVELGWRADIEVFAPKPDDPCFGYQLCVAGCDEVAQTSRGLCRRCDRLWLEAGGVAPIEEFIGSIPPRVKSRGGDLCRVCRTLGHERPVRMNGLCIGCASCADERGQEVEHYIRGDGRFPPARPRPSYGRCAALACDRWAHRPQPPVCEPHDRAWRQAGRPSGRAFQRWCDSQAPAENLGRQAVLRGLDHRVQLELLFGLQQTRKHGRRSRVRDIQISVNVLRRNHAASIATFDLDLLKTGGQRYFLMFVLDELSLLRATPRSEFDKDDWDCRVFGFGGALSLHFGSISQLWLRAAAKSWAYERLPTREHPRSCARVLAGVMRLSESLRRNRDDHGDDPRLLGRQDMAGFLNDLAHFEAAGEISRLTRRVLMNSVGQFLVEARSHGLTRPGQPMEGLPDVFMRRHSDRIAGQSREDQGRALPQVVVDQLLADPALDAAEAFRGPGFRALVELQAEIGRRTEEVCSLRWACLEFDDTVDDNGEVGRAPVIAYNMPKVAKTNCRLPISTRAAEIIQAQQARVRSLYPATPPAKLALFPRACKNAEGHQGISVMKLCPDFRAWVDELPRLVGTDGEPFARDDITFYSWRHTYAQRHADNGTPVEVLAELMGHTRLTTTQVYYRVSHHRKRTAVDTLAAFQLDRLGGRTRPMVEQLLDTERARDAVGQVAVPFGVCVEPTNVRASGQACPFRHQCFGCAHLRTDPSFLPELRDYLTRLLADQERLRAAVPELDDWARRGALPSAQEVEAVRRLVERCEELLADLPDDQRPLVEEAISVLRKGRAQLDTAVPVRFLGAARQTQPRLFPHVGKGAQDG